MRCIDCSVTCGKKKPPHEGACVWCNDTRQVSDDVAEVQKRMRRRNLPNILTNLEHTAFSAKEFWKELRKKKRPKGFSEVEWTKNMVRAEQNSKSAHADAIAARWELMKLPNRTDVHFRANENMVEFQPE